MSKKAKLTPAEAAAIAAVSAVYAPQVGNVLKAERQIEKAKGGVWGGFKGMIALGRAASHNVEAMKLGITAACAEGGVKAGTVRGYLSTLASVYGEVSEGTLTAEEAERLSIQDARKRYKKVKPATATTGGESEAEEAGPQTARDALLSRLNAAVAVMSDEDLELVVSSAEEMAANPALPGENEEVEQEAIAA